MTKSYETISHCLNINVTGIPKGREWKRRNTEKMITENVTKVMKDFKSQIEESQRILRKINTWRKSWKQPQEKKPDYISKNKDKHISYPKLCKLEDSEVTSLKCWKKQSVNPEFYLHWAKISFKNGEIKTFQTNKNRENSLSADLHYKKC